jgi:glucose-1-phosphate cytidylyltransferase
MNDFLLCLGYKGDIVKQYFLKYNEALSNDFVLTGGGRNIRLLGTDIEAWNITFMDTGLNTNIGERLRVLQRDLQGEEMFCVNYGDNLTDAPLLEMLDDFKGRDKIAALLSVRPRYSFHVISNRSDGVVTALSDVHDSDLWVNGGYFIFRREVFDYIGEGDDLLEEPFQRLVALDELIAYRYDGFWAALDTLKDLENLQSLHDRGRAPWLA